MPPGNITAHCAEIRHLPSLYTCTFRLWGAETSTNIWGGRLTGLCDGTGEDGGDTCQRRTTIDSLRPIASGK
ncbi:Hypp4895 [Branchiostoma lanceolatum]|uniref:Hypp4895 protein n=1 Tax=Branchiostoma lanceolatum TaxID=7740 RepID=A0A8K0AC64_BRALA|nr:Hypp4895 [Branchiostoma lanceolatum]